MLKTLAEAAEETGLSVREILNMAYEGEVSIRAVVRQFEATMRPYNWAENPHPPIIRKCSGDALILPCSAAQQLDGFGSVELSIFPVEDEGPMADYFWSLTEPQIISIEQVRVDVDMLRSRADSVAVREEHQESAVSTPEKRLVGWKKDAQEHWHIIMQLSKGSPDARDVARVLVNIGTLSKVAGQRDQYTWEPTNSSDAKGKPLTLKTIKNSMPELFAMAVTRKNPA